eukprot:9348269-Alexandrium_andersonii.AAC.1
MASAQSRGPLGEQELLSSRGSATREVKVGVPGPGFAHGAAMQISRRRGTARIYGALGVHLETLCQQLAPR